MKSWDLISYPFLNETQKMVDHEVLTDQLASILGRIYAMPTPLKDETFWMMDRVLHLNGSVRGKNAITTSDVEEGLAFYHLLKQRNETRMTRFVYPVGHPIACEYHVARATAKKVVRNLHLMQHDGLEINEVLIDFANVIANLLFACSIEINRHFDIDEVEFHSKSY